MGEAALSDRGKREVDGTASRSSCVDPPSGERAALRSSGLPGLDDIPWGTHILQLCAHPQDLLEVVPGFLAPGIAANERCIWIVGPGLSPPRAVDALAEVVPDLEARIERGQVSVVDHADWYLAGGRFDPPSVLRLWEEALREACDRGFEGLRATGDFFWASTGDLDRIAEYEASVEKAIRRTRMIALCAFPAGRSAPAQMASLVAQHEWMLFRVGTGWTAIRSSRLERTDARLRDLLARIPALVFCCASEPPFRPFFASDAIQCLGVRPEAWVEEPDGWGRILPPDDGPLVFQALEEVARSGIARIVEHRAMGKRGEEIWLRTHLRLVRPPDGEPPWIDGIALDVTEERRVREELRRSEAYHRVLVEGAPVPILVLREERVAYANPAAAALLGVEEPGHLVGRPGIGLVERGPRDPLRPGDAPDRLAGEGEVLRPDGGRRWVAVRTAPVELDGGRSEIVFLQDLTDRRRAEAAVEEERQRLAGCVQGSSVASFVLDAMGKVLYWNRACEALTGVAASEVVGTRDHWKALWSHKRFCLADMALTGEIAGWAREYGVRDHAFIPGALAVEGWHTDSRGRRRYIFATAAPVRGPRGEILAAIETLIDLTRQVEAEEELRRRLAELTTLLDAIPLGVCYIGPDLRIREVNRAFEEMVGGSAEDLVGKPWCDAIGGESGWYGDEDCCEVCPRTRHDVRARGEAASAPGDHHADGRRPCALGRSMDGGRPVTEEYDRKGRQLRVEVRPVRDASGRCVGFLELAEDVTEERELQRKLAQSEKLAALGTTIAGIAHELNNPLTGVIGFATLLKRDRALRTGIREDIAKILGQAERCRRIVRGLLRFARSGTEIPSRRPVRIESILRDSIGDQRPALDARGIEVITDCEPEGLTVLADAHQLAQVFENLLANARQAMAGAGRGGKVRIRARLRGPEVVVEVEDEGPGIEAPDRVFDPFYTTKAPGQGTGLGLSVSHGIIAEHGGIIEAENTGRGARFRVVLPATDPEEASDGDRPAASGPADFARSGPAGFGREDPSSVGERTPRADGPAGSRGSDPGARILVVDDEQIVREVTSRIIAAIGHEPVCVSSGREAREMLEEGAFDAVLCDVHMAGVSGLELLDWVHRERPSLAGRFVLMTGDTVSREVLEAVRTAGTPALPKPFETGDMVRVLQEVLERAEAGEG